MCLRLQVLSSPAWEAMLTHGDEVVAAFQHHVPGPRIVHVSVFGPRLLPLLLGEVHSDVRRGHPPL